MRFGRCILLFGGCGGVGRFDYGRLNCEVNFEMVLGRYCGRLEVSNLPCSGQVSSFTECLLCWTRLLLTGSTAGIHSVCMPLATPPKLWGLIVIFSAIPPQETVRLNNPHEAMTKPKF